MGVCVHLISLCRSVYRQRPCDGLIPRPRIPTECVQITKLKSGQGPTKGCRAIDRYILAVSTINYYAIFVLRNVQSLYTNILSLSALILTGL
jgi:hypothetical protein